MFENPICAGIVLIVLLIVFIKGGHWIERSFDEMDRDLKRALEKEKQRDRAIEKLGDWLDRH